MRIFTVFDAAELHEDRAANVLVGLDPERIVALGRRALGGRPLAGSLPELWDGRSAARIVDILNRELR
jgi:hypothetical protein